MSRSPDATTDGRREADGGISAAIARAPAPPATLVRTLLVVAAAAALVTVLALPSVVGRPGRPAGQSADVGWVGFPFAANGVNAPTGRKPEASKLWFTDGSWWGILFRPSRDAYVIHRLDQGSSTWVDTGVVVDDRNVSRADVLWSDPHLYIVSGGLDPRSAKHAALFMRFSYDPETEGYALDAGFPVRLTDGGAETFVLDRDDDGRAWVTFTSGRTVYVTHTLGTDRDWTPPFPLPLPEAASLTDDDISAVVAYEGHIGVMWSDQTDGAMYFASHEDGADDRRWTVTAAIQGPSLADDHINLKALRDDPAGLVVAVVKTSRNDAPGASPQDPLVLVLVLKPDGSWEQHVVGRVRDNQTRPLLLVDEDHRQLYVFMSAPCCSGGTIYYKVSSLDRIEFAAGVGEPFLRRGAPSAVNNPSGTKQNLGAKTGLVVIASDDEADIYLFNSLRLDGPAVPRPSPTPRPEPVSSPDAGTGVSPRPSQESLVWLEDGFESGGLDLWTEVVVGQGSSARVEEGMARTDRAAAHLVAGTGKEAHAALRFALPEPQAVVRVGLDFRLLAEGPTDGNVPLVRFFDASGTRLAFVYRQNQRGGRIWVAFGKEHVPTSGRVDLNTWTRLEAAMRRDGSRLVVEVRIDGRLVGEASTEAPGAAAKVVQVGNDSSNAPFDLVIDNVRVYR